MRYLVTVKIYDADADYRYVKTQKQFSMSHTKLQELIELVHSLFGDEFDEKTGVEGGMLNKYSFESKRVIVGAHVLDTNPVDFIKSAL